MYNILKTIRRSVIAIAVMQMITACSSPQTADNESVYVSILPLRGLLQEIVGKDLRIDVLVPAGASPETFEPTPRQFVALNRAQLIFDIGLLDFETALLQKVDDSQKIVNLSEGIELLAGSCSHIHADGHRHAHGIDPHIWTSPQALQRMAANAYTAIRRIYPDSTRYEDNYRRLQAKLAALDAQTASMLTESGVQLFVIYHPALTYYAHDYGLQQVAIEEDGKEPSARHLARLIEQARASRVKHIFYQSQFPATAVEVIAGDIGAEPVQIDPLREDIIANIEEITRLITAQ